jgi:DegV family protein with EDD domain
MSVAIITDSNVCLPKEVIEEYGIHIVPLEFTFANRTYRDGIDITPSEFYKLLKSARGLPTTSAPSPGVYLNAYHELSKHADSILCLTLPAKLTMAFDSAQKAAEVAKEEIPHITIYVLDSQTAAGAQGLVALAAAKEASLGRSIAEVTEAARQMIPRVSIIAILDTLHYLAKGGRIPNVAAWASSILSIKPVVEFSQGRAELLEKTRTKHHAMERLLAILKERVGNNAIHGNLMHADVLDESESLKLKILSEFDCKELYVTEFTPVMGVHTGPGVIALAFYCEE